MLFLGIQESLTNTVQSIIMAIPLYRLISGKTSRPCDLWDSVCAVMTHRTNGCRGVLGADLQCQPLSPPKTRRRWDRKGQ